jgi:hypothetical protein
VRLKVLHRLWRSGIFDQEAGQTRGHRDSRRRRPSFDEVCKRVGEILAASADVTVWIAAFKRDRLCRDYDAAERLAHELDRLGRLASGLARDLVRAWCMFGDAGLLKHSEYPCATELLMLHQHITAGGNSAALLPEHLAEMRADLAAVYRTLNDQHYVKQYQALHGREAHLWDQSLLHQPEFAAQRQKHQDRMAPLFDMLVDGLAE